MQKVYSIGSIDCVPSSFGNALLWGWGLDIEKTMKSSHKMLKIANEETDYAEKRIWSAVM